MRTNCLLLAAVLASLACACGRPTTHGLPAVSPVLPAPASLPRTPSWAAGWVPLDRYEDQGYPNNRVGTVPATDAIWFASFAGVSLDDLAYAIYRVELPGPGLELSFDWSIVPEPGTFFIGLGDLTADRWRWFPLPDGQPLSVPDAAPYRDVDGTALVALVQVGAPHGELTESELNGLRLVSNPPSGWQFHTAAELTLPADSDSLYLRQLVEHNGKPALLFMRDYEVEPRRTDALLLTSATAEGTDGSWTLAEPLWGSEYVVGELSASAGLYSTGTELWLAAVSGVDSTFTFMTSADPAGPWDTHTEVVAWPHLAPHSVRVGAVAGAPAVSYMSPPDWDLPGDNQYIGYAYPAGGSWSFTTALDVGYQGNLAQALEPMDVGGRPLIVHTQSGTQGVHYGYAASAAPTGLGDWSHEQIADMNLDDFRLGMDGDLLNGRPYVMLTHTQFAATPELRLLHLPVDDPAAANWQSHRVDYFDLTNVTNHEFAVVGGLPQILNVYSVFDSYMQTPLQLQSAGQSMPDGPEDWSATQVSPDFGSTGMLFEEIAGRPALALTYRWLGADGAARVKIVYGTLAP